MIVAFTFNVIAASVLFYPVFAFRALLNPFVFDHYHQQSIRFIVFSFLIFTRPIVHFCFALNAVKYLAFTTIDNLIALIINQGLSTFLVRAINVGSLLNSQFQTELIVFFNKFRTQFEYSRLVNFNLAARNFAYYIEVLIIDFILKKTLQTNFMVPVITLESNLHVLAFSTKNARLLFFLL